MLTDDELADFEAAVAGWTQTPEVLAALDQVRTQLDERALSAPLPAATGDVLRRRTCSKPYASSC